MVKEHIHYVNMSRIFIGSVKNYKQVPKFMKTALAKLNSVDKIPHEAKQYYIVVEFDEYKQEWAFFIEFRLRPEFASSVIQTINEKQMSAYREAIKVHEDNINELLQSGIKEKRQKGTGLFG